MSIKSLNGRQNKRGLTRKPRSQSILIFKIFSVFVVAVIGVAMYFQH